MKITLIETSPPGLKGSMSRYAELLIQALLLTNNSDKIETSRINLALPYLLLSRVPTSFRSWFHHFWIILNASTRLPKMNTDILHIIDGSQAYISVWIKQRTSIGTVHDIIPFLQLLGHLDSSHLGKSSGWVIKKSIKGLQQLKHVIAVSVNTAKDLEHFANINSKTVSVIPHAIPQRILSQVHSIQTLPWSERLESKQAFILHVGNNAFYKNRERLFRIFSQVRSFCEIELKLVGSPPTPKEKQIIHDLEIDRFVTFITNPYDDTLFDLYRKASLFLFPSLYEGFGWPPLEAMAFGCPVVCSNAASLPEVVGDAALMCSPEDEKLMAENCLAILQDASVANDLIERGFNWVKLFSPERMGRQVMEVYKKVLNQI
jgi:glycosyltransferase involved in cell wall biosynthesis